jgi:hypothetical protein
MAHLIEIEPDGRVLDHMIERWRGPTERFTLWKSDRNSPKAPRLHSVRPLLRFRQVACNQSRRRQGRRLVLFGRLLSGETTRQLNYLSTATQGAMTWDTGRARTPRHAR